MYKYWLFLAKSFPKGAPKSNVSDSNSILSSFPSFSAVADGLKNAGYLQLYGDMCGHSFQIDKYEDYLCLLTVGYT